MKFDKITKSDDNFSTTLAIEDSKQSFIDNTKNVIRTDDFCLAVTLFHTGATLLSVEKEDSGKQVFIFKKICNFEDIEDEFFSDLLTVKAFSFLESIKSFRKTIDKHLNKDNK